MCGKCVALAFEWFGNLVSAKLCLVDIICPNGSLWDVNLQHKVD